MMISYAKRIHKTERNSDRRTRTQAHTHTNERDEETTSHQKSSFESDSTGQQTLTKRKQDAVIIAHTTLSAGPYTFVRMHF